MNVLRLSVFADQDNVAQLEIVRLESDRQAIAYRFSFADADKLLEAAEKMRLVGNLMQIHAKRPTPTWGKR